MTEDDAGAKSEAGPEQRVAGVRVSPRGGRVGRYIHRSENLARQVEDAFQMVGLGKKIYQVSLLDSVPELE